MRLILVFLIVHLCLIQTTFGQSKKEIDYLALKARQLLETNLHQADSLSQLALNDAIQIEYKQGEASALMVLASSFRIKGQYHEALEYYERAILIRKNLGNPAPLASGFVGAATTTLEYAFSGEGNQKELITRARNYYNSAIKIFSSLDSNIDLAKCFISLGNLEAHLGDYKTSNELLRKAIRLGLDIKDSLTVSRASRNLASNCFNRNLFDSTKFWSRFSMKYQCVTCYELQIANYINLGLGHYRLYEDDSALINFKRAEILSEGKLFNHQRSSVYYNLGEFYLDINNRLSALYFRAYANLKDSILGDQKLKQFAQNQERFHTLEKEAEAIEAKAKTQIAQRNQLIAWVIAFTILIVGFLTVLNYRHKKQLAEQEKDLTNRKIDGLLQGQEMKKLDAMLEGQESERKRIAADLHDRLGSMLGAIKLHFSHIEDRIEKLQVENRNEYLKATELLDEATAEVRRIAHDLSTGTLVKFGLIPALHELKYTLESSGEIKINLFETQMSERLDSEVEITTYRIVQELISNALKHAKCNSIDIHLTNNVKDLTILVEDDGIGFKPSEINEGMGIKNIRQRASKLNGTLTLDSTPNQGTTVIVEIPLKPSSL